PIDQPWFQPRRARPNAAVDLPFISPVWTISSGRLRRWRVVSPSSGTLVTWPCGMSPPSSAVRGNECSSTRLRSRRSCGPGRADDVGDAVDRQLVDPHQLPRRGPGDLRGEAEADGAGLAVHHDGGHTVGGEERGGAAGVPYGVAAVSDR